MTALVSLRRNLSYAAAGTAAYGFSQWLQLIIIAQFASPSTVGVYSLALAISAPFFMFSNLRLRFVLASSAALRFPVGCYLGLRLVATFLVTGVLVLAGIAVESRQFAGVFLLVVLAKAVEAISDLLYGWFQKHERIDYLAISMCGVGVMTTVACLLGFVYSQSLIAATAGMLAARLIMLVIYDWRRAKTLGQDKSLHPSFALTSSVSIIADTLPLGLVALLVSLNVSVPRYIVSWRLGDDALGIFAALSYVPIAGYMIVGAFGQAMMSRFGVAVETGNRAEILRLLTRLVLLCATLGFAGVAIAVIAGEPIAEAIYGPEYAGHPELFVALMTSGAVSYVVLALVYVFTAMRDYWIQLAIYMCEFVVVSLGCWWGVEALGLEGAGVAMILSQLAVLSMSTWLLRRRLRLFQSSTHAKRA